VVVYLGHGGKPCPESRAGELEPVGEGHCDDSDEGEDKDEDEDYLYDFEDMPLKAGKVDENGNSMMVIVDKSGVHHLPVNWCECEGCPKQDMQLLAMGLFPASFKRFHSAFTFGVLDDFLLENLECKTSAYHYISKLARVTSPEFPHSATVWPISLYAGCGFNWIYQNRYKELLRVSRQWRNLKDRKSFGFGHHDREPGPGELTTFCPVCPQAGLNLPDDWKDDPNRYTMQHMSLEFSFTEKQCRTVYTRGLVKDGNFTAVHQIQKNPDDDVWLAEGEGFMVGQEHYQNHLKVAKEYKEACLTLNLHIRIH
jgi:hypothetical protein